MENDHGVSSGREQQSRAVRRVMDRAIRRLNVLEFFILGGAAVAAIAGGWLAAWLSRGALGLPFRTVWFGATFLLFVVPGVLVWIREQKAKRLAGQRDASSSGGERP
ncbi:MAG: hypothetical protein ACR2QM_14415 [Longimicrobiales bacterium]